MRIAGAFIVWTAFIFICGAAAYAGSEKDAITPGTENIYLRFTQGRRHDSITYRVSKIDAYLPTQATEEPEGLCHLAENGQQSY